MRSEQTQAGGIAVATDFIERRSSMICRLALAISAAAVMCASSLPVGAEEVGVGIGPVGVTIGERDHDRDRDRDHNKTVIIKKDRDHGDRDKTVIIKNGRDRDHDRD
jgi:hypothetical protein